MNSNSFHFKITDMDSAQHAFEMMLDVAEARDLDNILTAAPRAYRVIFRPARLHVDKYVDELKQKASPQNPMFCFQSSPGTYIFVGTNN